MILLNCVRPETEESRALAARMEAEYGHAVLPVNCEDLTAARINEILQSVLYEFDVRELAFELPRWVTMLEPDHWLQQARLSGGGRVRAQVNR